MGFTFTLPDLGEGLVEAEIVSWLVDVGAEVRADQPLVEVETAKATVEISSPVAGVVRRLGGAVGEVLPVGAVLVEFGGDAAATVTTSATAAPSPGPAASSPGSVAPEASPAPVAGSAAASASPAGVAAPLPRRVLASPSTRARATALGLDLAALVGTGPGGRVTRDDVERAAAATPSPAASADRNAGARPVVGGLSDGSHPGGADRAAAAPETGGRGDPVGLVDRDVPLRGIRREIARTMTASWQQIPHITEFREVDASGLVRAHRALRDRWPGDRPRLTLLPILALACTAALRRHPVLNASLDLHRDTIRYHGAVHLGIATATPHGLTVPVVCDAHRLDLAEITVAIADLVAAARSRRARPDQLTGGTFTISNFGSYGTWLGTPVINPPQAAIAGFGRIRDAVVAVDGQPVVRPTLPLAVSADHRLIDGDVLGAFVGELEALLADPVLLFAGIG